MPLMMTGILAQVASTSMLTWLLLTGSGVLALALLVLALTPWGHSRPVWKCVILSVVAHVLLMGLAYGTRLIWQTPPTTQFPAQDTLASIQVQWEDIEPEQETNELETTALSEPAWQPTAAPVAEAARPTDLPRPELTSVPDELAEPPTTARTATDPAETAILPPLPTQAPIVAQADPPLPANLPAAQIEVPRQSNQAPAQPNLEMPSALDRPADLLASSTSSSVENLAQSSLAERELDWSPQLPRPQMESPPLEAAEPEPDAPSQPPSTAASDSSSPPRRLADGQPLPQLYRLRAPAGRLQVVQERGGSVETEEAVARGLRWLAENQSADGRWDPRSTGGGREDRVFGHNREGAGIQADAGITGLATLAFLGAGNTHLEGDYQETVQRSLEFLMQQQASNGDLAGDAKLFARMYCHSMALLALSEALAMTGDKRLQAAVRQGVAYSIAAQNNRDGGWRYQPGDSGDMSQFGWQVLALHSAELGGIAIPQVTTNRMRFFLSQCTSGQHGGLAAYRPRQGPTTTMTAEALVCRFFLDAALRTETIDESVALISKQRPERGQVNLYYWYYGTLAMYHAGGPAWQRWNEDLKSTLLALQLTAGPDAGSWPANGLWGGYGGQVYATATATLSLEVYYRYLPVSREMTASMERGRISR